MGCCGSGVDRVGEGGGKRKSYVGWGEGVNVPKGKTSSSNRTCLEIIILLDDKSRHR